MGGPGSKSMCEDRFLSWIMGSLCRVRHKTMWVLYWRTIMGLLGCYVGFYILNTAIIFLWVHGNSPLQSLYYSLHHRNSYEEATYGRMQIAGSDYMWAGTKYYLHPAACVWGADTDQELIRTNEAYALVPLLNLFFPGYNRLKHLIDMSISILFFE